VIRKVFYLCIKSNYIFIYNNIKAVWDAYKDRTKIGNKVNIPATFIVVPNNQYECHTFLKMNEHIYNDDNYLQLLQRWTSTQFLLKKSYETDDREHIKKKLGEFSRRELQYINQAIGAAFVCIIPRQLGYYMSLLSGLQSFEELTKTNLIKAKVVYGQIITDRHGNVINHKNSFMPRIKAPTSSVNYVARKLKLECFAVLEKRIVAEGYQSLEELIGEIEGYYQFYEEERYCPLDKKETQRPVFYGQHKAHKEFELKPAYAECLFNNQYAPPKTGRDGSTAIEAHNAYIEQQEFNRGKKGLTNLYIQETKIFVAMSLIKFRWWRERDYKGTDWSQSLIKDYNDYSNKIFECTWINDIIKSRGYYEIKNGDNEKDIRNYIQHMVQLHELKFTDRRPRWKSQYNLILFSHLMQESSERNWKFDAKALAKISMLFKHQFTDDFLIRRCEEWQFYIQ